MTRPDEPRDREPAIRFLAWTPELKWLLLGALAGGCVGAVVAALAEPRLAPPTARALSLAAMLTVLWLVRAAGLGELRGASAGRVLGTSAVGFALTYFIARAVLAVLRRA